MADLTDKQKVRLMSGDNDTENQIFSDEEVNFFLSANDSNIYLAAADALDAQAAVAAKEATAQKSEEFMLDKKSVSKELREQAIGLRKMSMESIVPWSDIVEGEFPWPWSTIGA